MAIIENINVSTPGDGLGDPLRNSQIKANNNFDELNDKKVEKVAGKDLTANDFTDTLKAKLDGIEEGAEVNVQADWNQTDDTQDDYIKNKPTLEQFFSAVGGFDYNDLATQTTPLAYTTGLLQLTNDTLGAFTQTNLNPLGVTQVWDSITNAFVFGQLDVGDEVFLRVDIDLTTTSANQISGLSLLFGEGTASEYTLPIDIQIYHRTAGLHNVIKEIQFYIGNEDWRVTPVKLLFNSSAIASIKVNGWHPYIIRKSVNIIDINDDNYKTFSILAIEPNSTTNTVADGGVVIGYNSLTGKINRIVFDVNYSKYVYNYDQVSGTYKFSLNWFDKDVERTFTSYVSNFTAVGSHYILDLEETLPYTDFVLNDKIEVFFNAHKTNVYINDLAGAGNLTQSWSADKLTTDFSLKADLVGGKIPQSQIPQIAITNTFVVASEIEMLGLTAETGDVAIRTDINKTFILTTDDPTILANWEEFLTPTDSVNSVNGQQGVVVLDSDDITEGGSNLYFTNLRVLSTPLTGLSTATSQVITATDTILQAFGYLQGQLNNRWGLQGNAGTNPATDFIGTTDGQGLSIRTNNIERIFVRNEQIVDFNVNGINQYNESVNSNLNLYNYNSTRQPQLGFFRARGTKSAPSQVLANDFLASLFTAGFRDNGSFSPSINFLRVQASENYTSTGTGYNLDLRTTPNGTTASIQRLFISQNGNILIGGTSTNPTETLHIQSGNILLAVNGTTSNSNNTIRNSGTNLIYKNNAGVENALFSGTNASLSDITTGTDATKIITAQSLRLISNVNGTTSNATAFGYQAGNNQLSETSFGRLAGGGNLGANLTAIGERAGNGNIGSDVIAIGVGSGIANTFNNVSLFGFGASADAENQAVFNFSSRNARLSFNNLTDSRKWNLPDANGTFALTSDLSNFISQNGNSFGAKLTIGTNDAQAFAIETSGSERVTVLSNGNVGIGTTSPNEVAQLQIESTTKGFLPPRMTTAQKDAITSPPAGLVVYDTTLNKLCVRTASAWETITST